jgi:hypothetical protein
VLKKRNITLAPMMLRPAQKDILQAEQILSLLIEDRPGDILLALEACQSQPKKFRQQLRQGIKKLNTHLQARLENEFLA